MRVSLRPSLAGAVALLLSLGVVSCARCVSPVAGGGGSPALLELTPKTATSLVVVPDLASLGQKLAGLQRLKVANVIAQLQGAGNATELVDASVAAFGVDFRSEQAMKDAGLAPQRGLAAVLMPNGAAYSLWGVSNEDKFIETLGTLAKNRLGATVRSRRAENGRTVVTFERPGGSPELGVTMAGHYAVVAVSKSVAELTTAAAVTAEQSFARDEGLKAALQRLPKERDLFVHLARNDFGAIDAPDVKVTATLFLGASGLVAQADLTGLKPEELAWAVRPPKTEAAKDTPLSALPADAVLTARYAGEPSSLAGVWQKFLGRSVAAAVQKAGFDVKTELLDNLQPGAVLGVSLAPTAALGAGMPQLDVRRTNPFRYLQLTAVGTPKDDAKVDATLEKLAKAGPALSMRVEKVDLQGHPAFKTSYVQGEGASFAHFQGRVLLGAPLPRLTEAMARVQSETMVMNPSLEKDLAEKGAGVAVLELNKLSDQVRALPSEAWGVGGFAIKATVVRWLDALSDLRSLVLGVSSDHGALEIRFELRLNPT